MRVPATRRTAAFLAVAGAAALGFGAGAGAFAGPAASVAPAAALCTAPGQPVLGAKPDGQGGYVCPSGRTLAVVAAQEAVRLLEEAQAVLSGRLDALQRATAVTTLTSPVPFAARPDGTLAPARTTVSCGSTGKALSGSVRTTGARVVQSHAADDGRGWYFDLQPTSSTPSVTTYVVCSGASGGTGGGTSPVPGTTGG